MRKRVRLGIVSSAVVGACYGAGPVPTAPSDVELVFVRPPPSTPCATGSYIGNVSFDASGTGYAVVLPYTPRLNCDHIASPTPADVEIWRFDDGGEHEIAMGSAGKSDGTQTLVKVAAPFTPGGPVTWLYQSPSTVFALDLGPGAIAAGSGSGFLDPAALVVDATTIYAAGHTDGAPAVHNVDNPTFPAAPGSSPTGFSVVSFVTAPVGGGSTTDFPVQPRFACEFSKDCLVASSSSLFYFAFTDAAEVVARFPKSGTGSADETVVDTLALTTTINSVGLAADEAHVAWSTSTDPNRLDGLAFGECKIWWADAAAPQPTPTLLFSTTKFACRDLVIDGSSIYFAIFSIRRFENDSFALFMHGDGVGRITVGAGTPKVETLDMQVSGIASGPRRVFLHGPSMYLIDPLAITRVDKTALDGRLDIAP